MKIFKKLLSILSDKQVAALLLCAARHLASRTKTTIDDQLVEALSLAVLGEDYGLQRKARVAGPKTKAKAKPKAAPKNEKTKA